MYYIDSQRTLVRRESSLIVPKAPHGSEVDISVNTARDRDSTAILPEEYDSSYKFSTKLCVPVRKEIITLFFEHMLPHIVDSWEPIVPPEPVEEIIEEELQINLSESKPRKKSLTSGSKSKRKHSKSESTEEQAAQSTVRRPSRSQSHRIGILSEQPVPQIVIPQSWWSGSDERAIITFRNGNCYEGSISMKCMHGHGRFQWANGTIYLGNFKRNAICGRGMIQWKDETWYEGEFVGNIRHGSGLYVDTRCGRYYTGEWHLGTKHGQGFINYSSLNSYDGRWHHNVRSGFGKRDYSALSGYKGEWDCNFIEGKGLMIWPNHDFYRGDWRNAKMHGYGIYIWDMYYNNSMSHPAIPMYRGYWENSMRHGYGCLNLGFWLGAYYKGVFKNNKKHGCGKFVANNGIIIHSKHLFDEDNMTSLCSVQNLEPYRFDICGTVDLLYHIAEAYQNIDKDDEIRADLINDFFLYNEFEWMNDTPLKREMDSINIEDFVSFEERSLKNALRCYETELREIYNQYATICNNAKTHFTPILIRLYLWQLYYDCDIHKKGLTLIQIDKIVYRNPDWLSNTIHNAFEKIYFWQFLHSLITVARKLYCSRIFPGPKPDNLLGTAFRKFMENDLIPGAGLRKGKLVNGYARIIPIKPLYRLYRSLGEPHTVRTFLNAVHRSPEDLEPPPVEMEANDLGVPTGYNAYILGDEMDFVPYDPFPKLSHKSEFQQYSDLMLYNFGNLSSKTILQIFGEIFPQVLCNETILDLEVKLSFLDFFEAFIVCAEESILQKDEEVELRSRISNEL